MAVDLATATKICRQLDEAANGATERALPLAASTVSDTCQSCGRHVDDGQQHVRGCDRSTNRYRMPDFTGQPSPLAAGAPAVPEATVPPASSLPTRAGAGGATPRRPS